MRDGKLYYSIREVWSSREMKMKETSVLLIEIILFCRIGRKNKRGLIRFGCEYETKELYLRKDVMKKYLTSVVSSYYFFLLYTSYFSDLK